MSASRPGLRVMVHQLFGGSLGDEVFASSVGKTLARVELRSGGEAEDGLHISFADGSEIRLYDGARSGCESRYMRTDDQLSDYVGAKLLGLELRDAPNEEDDEVHEIQFLEIKTDRGSFVLSNHNEHNGYYGGFLLRAEQVVPARSVKP